MNHQAGEESDAHYQQCVYARGQIYTDRQGWHQLAQCAQRAEFNHCTKRRQTRAKCNNTNTMRARSRKESVSDYAKSNADGVCWQNMLKVYTIWLFLPYNMGIFKTRPTNRCRISMSVVVLEFKMATSGL